MRVLIHEYPLCRARHYCLAKMRVAVTPSFVSVTTILPPSSLRLHSAVHLLLSTLRLHTLSAVYLSPQQGKNMFQLGVCLIT